MKKSISVTMKPEMPPSPVEKSPLTTYISNTKPRPGKSVLSDISLHILPGQTIGLLGQTGSAKTTLVQLIPRLYEATEGTVSIDGRPVKEYPLTHLRDAIACVLQKNTLFSGTVRDNLRWGNPDASDEEIEEACLIACVDEFIERLKKGYDTELGQGGVNVSGGQKQRLCIARAILKKPRILILDDSTSAVDSATEAKIREGLAHFLPDTTKIIIAQRISLSAMRIRFSSFRTEKLQAQARTGNCWSIIRSIRKFITHSWKEVSCNGSVLRI